MCHLTLACWIDPDTLPSSCQVWLTAYSILNTIFHIYLGKISVSDIPWNIYKILSTYELEFVYLNYKLKFKGTNNKGCGTVYVHITRYGIIQ